MIGYINFVSGIIFRTYKIIRILCIIAVFICALGMIVSKDRKIKKQLFNFVVKIATGYTLIYLATLMAI